MSDEVEHYLAVYHQDGCTTRGLKTGGQIGQGRFPREVGWG
jgi:hypothetical protein